MFLKRFFSPRPAVLAGRALYASAVAQARTPAFYSVMSVPDTSDGRFELYSLHVVLLLRRLKGQGPEAAEAGQALFDAYIASLDIALREMGVGDLSVGKKMKKLGRAFYGRIKSWEDSLDDRAALEDLITRTLYAAVGAPPTAKMADYCIKVALHLSNTPLDALLRGEAQWPPVTS